ncbi:MAG: DUF4266 domain-containing protein [Polyangiaceae bacterium]
MGKGTNGEKSGSAARGASTPSRSSTRNMATALVALAMLAFSSGCVKVAAYERGALAHPTMSAEDVSSALDEHVRAVSEGATGSLGAAGGGCGCN